MTKVRQRVSLPVDAVKLALERERQKREDIKPIELLKVALSAYLAFTFNPAVKPPLTYSRTSPRC